MRRDNCILIPTTLGVGDRFLSPVTAEETRDMISFCNVDIPVAPDVPGSETSTPATESYSCVRQLEMELEKHRPQRLVGISSLRISMASTLGTIGERK